MMWLRRWQFLTVAIAAALGLTGLAIAQYATSAEHRAGPCTVAEAAALLTDVKHSLSSPITQAETAVSGRAVFGEWQDRGMNQRPSLVCRVALLVGEDRLVETIINPENGEVLTQRNLQTVSMSSECDVDAKHDFAMARSWHKATALLGTKVTNNANENLGKLEDIVIDTDSGRILYGVLSFGGFLGVGDKLFALPWQSLQLSGDNRAFVLSVDKEVLKGAPGFDKNVWPDFADEKFATSTYDYYQQKPYWEVQTAEAAKQEKADRAAAGYRERWNQRMTNWHKASELCGIEVDSVDGKSIGKLSDLAVDAEHGRALYGVLTYQDKNFALPLSKFKRSREGKHLVLSVDKTLLSEDFAFSKEKWPNMADREWAMVIHSHYHVEPYWVDRTRSDKTAAQVAACCKSHKLALADNIAAAERHSKGRAVHGECADLGRGINGAAPSMMCRVTLLVGEDRLIEAIVNTATGRVVGERELDGAGAIGLRPKFVNDGFAMPRNWQKATDLMGAKVMNKADEKLGQIEDIIVDGDSGRILFGVLSFGGFLGVGDKLFALPWSALRLSGDGKVFALDVDKETLKQAAGFDKTNWPNFADAQFAAANYKQYKQKPYWESRTAGAEEKQLGRTPANSRDRWNQEASTWLKASDLCCMTVRNEQDVELGKLEDLALDTESGRVLYGILSHRGRLQAIPMPSLRSSSDTKHLVLNVNESQLADSMSFTTDTWPNFRDEEWASRTYAHYRVAPYWKPSR
ncbi:MAG: PRC-barrel domain-containing protein [Planctomycetota bacterium]